MDCVGKAHKKNLREFLDLVVVKKRKQAFCRAKAIAAAAAAADDYLDDGEVEEEELEGAVGDHDLFEPSGWNDTPWPKLIPLHVLTRVSTIQTIAF